MGTTLLRAKSAGLVVLWTIVLSSFLVVQGFVGGMIKLLDGRSDDLVHNGFHLASGLIGLSLIMGSHPRRAARLFAVGFGGLYLGLGTIGWFWPNVFGILPLGPADHVFHLLVGTMTLAIGLRAFSKRALLP